MNKYKVYFFLKKDDATLRILENFRVQPMGENEAVVLWMYFGNRAVLGYANKNEKNKKTRINSHNGTKLVLAIHKLRE